MIVAHPGTELYGSDRVLLESVRALVATGSKTIVTVPDDGDLVPHLRSAGAEVTQIDVPVIRKSLLSPAGVWRFVADLIRTLPRQVRFIRDSDASVVLVNTVTFPSWMLAGRLARRKVVCHVHEAERSSRILWRLLVAPLLLASKVIVNSQFTRNAVVSALPLLARRAETIYNPVVAPAEKDVHPPRARLHEPVRLLFLGRISPRKGAAVALDALALLRDRGIDARLQYLGAAFRGLEGFEQELRDRVSEMQLDGRVEFLGFRPDIWNLVAENDVVLVPSVLDEPFGNVAVEGILAQRPVVCSGTSGLLEATGGYSTVERCVPGDPSSLAEAIERLLDRWSVVREDVAEAAAEAVRRHDPAIYRERLARSVLQSDRDSTGSS